MCDGNFIVVSILPKIKKSEKHRSKLVVKNNNNVFFILHRNICLNSKNLIMHLFLKDKFLLSSDKFISQDKFILTAQGNSCSKAVLVCI